MPTYSAQYTGPYFMSMPGPGGARGMQYNGAGSVVYNGPRDWKFTGNDGTLISSNYNDGTNLQLGAQTSWWGGKSRRNRKGKKSKMRKSRKSRKSRKTMRRRR